MAAKSPSSSARVSATESLALWKEYRATEDRGVRDRLVLTFAPLVKYIVFKKVRELPARCDVEDFISCGLEALIASIDRYDPSKGATLEQFAAVHNRRPTREELADALAITVEELRRREDDISVSDVTSLNTLVISDEETTVERLDTIAHTDERLDPEHAAATTEAKERFRRAFDRLPRREREVAVLLYVKNLTLREIGEILGVSESRVCQIHGQTKKKLRTALADDAALFHLVA